MKSWIIVVIMSYKFYHKNKSRTVIGCIIYSLRNISLPSVQYNGENGPMTATQQVCRKARKSDRERNRQFYFDVESKKLAAQFQKWKIRVFF